jgi:pyrroloquinoline-quinone synthase
VTGAAALGPGAFVERLREAGARRYHDTHPFHVRMHEGRCTRHELQQWVANRWYYQTRIPVKDALIVAKSDDPAFRRRWLQRIQEQDGTDGVEGGLARWLRLAEGVGLARDEVLAQVSVLPRVRAVCDAYVDLVRDGTLLEAVAASLTECFAPDLMAARIRAWERHYPWVAADALAYFRGRVVQARSDADFALAFVTQRATTARDQDRCVRALIRKTQILNELLDAVSDACSDEDRAATRSAS